MATAFLGGLSTLIVSLGFLDGSATIEVKKL
jgi:hypothetical protein